MIKELSDVLTNGDVFKATQEVGFHNEEILKSPLNLPIKNKNKDCESHYFLQVSSYRSLWITF